MPEGDTIHRAADRLRPVLVGQPLVRLEAPRLVATAGRRPPPGTHIVAVEARGKHLLVRFDGGAILRTHLRMAGSWHLYRAGERWRKPKHLVRALVEVPGWVAVCFSAPDVELLHESQPVAAHLGPDLCDPDADIGTAVERMGRLVAPATTIAEVLLDQRVAAGIGNVYKSEVLHACAVDPFAPVSAIDEATRRRLLSTAARLLRVNVAKGGARETVPEGLGVYGRQGQPCRRCGSPIRARRHGEQGRSTYWCPRCQGGGGP